MKRALLALLVALLGAGAMVMLQYGDEVVAELTHREGGPTKTWAYEPYPEAPDLHLAAVGDVGETGERLDSVAAAMRRAGAQHTFDALLLLGDNVYPSGDPAGLPDTVFTPFAPVLDQGAQLLAVIGNHDIDEGVERGDAQLEQLGMPGRWWSRTLGDVLIVGLDSNDPGNPDQRAFLEQELSTTSAGWRIVVAHHPAYSAGYQGSSLDVREAWSPLFARHGVQLVLSGHDHDYQRSKVIDGVTYVVSGGGSVTKRTGDADFMERTFSWAHFTDIAIMGDELVLRSVGTDLDVADEVRIPRER